MPFATSTITWPSATKGRALAAVERTNTDGTANSRMSRPVHTSSMLLVNCISAGIFMPGRLGWTRVADRLSISCSSADHTSTSLPLTVSIRARAMPQVPAPRIPILCFIVFCPPYAPGGSAPGPLPAQGRGCSCSILHETSYRVNSLPDCTKLARVFRQFWR